MSSLNSDTTVRYRKVNENESEDVEINNLPPVSIVDNSNLYDQPQTSRESEGNGQKKKYELSTVLRKIYNQIDQLKYRMQRDTYKRCINNEWMLVGTLIDKILFLAYCLIVIVSTNSIFKY
jgi:hypothetical protein